LAFLVCCTRRVSFSSTTREHLVVDVSTDDVPVRADPFTQNAQPPHDAAADIKGPQTRATRQLGKEHAPSRFPNPRLELPAITFRRLASE